MQAIGHKDSLVTRVHLTQMALCKQVCMHLSPLLAQVFCLVMCFLHFSCSLSKFGLCSNAVIPSGRQVRAQHALTALGPGTPVTFIVSLMAAAHQRLLHAAIDLRQHCEKWYCRFLTSKVRCRQQSMANQDSHSHAFGLQTVRHC